MTTDNRTNEPTDYAALIEELREDALDAGHIYEEQLLTKAADAIAALEAAQGAGVAPQEPCPQPCEHLSAEDAREGRDCREHPCTCPTALTSDREKLIEEARAVVPQAETPQCGPCRRGQHGYCDGNEYLRCECSHGAAPQADALPSNRENCPGNEGHAGCGDFCSMCFLTAPVLPSGGVDEEKLAEVIAESRGFGNGWAQIPPLTREAYREIARAVAEWLKEKDNE